MDKFRKQEIEAARAANPHKGVKAIPKNSYTGVLVWQLPSGGYLGDSDGNYLSIHANVLDIERYMIQIAKMEEAARYYGYPDGKAVFLPGRGQVTDSEYEDQMEAMINGEEIPGDIFE
jgi:hypothetical protein